MSIKKILIIDDEEYYCRALKKLLESKSNFHVLTTTRGKEGIMLARTENPDVILLDVMMPDMAGTVVAEELSEDPRTKSIPIIFVTAIIKREEIKTHGGVFGKHKFVAKPVLIDELINKINAASV